MIKAIVRKLFLAFAIFISFESCHTQNRGGDQEEVSDFSFVFLTDIHLQPELKAPEGFSKAIQRVNELDPDFVITGGDLVMDALAVPYSRADSLYNLYQSLAKEFNMPVYNTMGNHELFGVYEKSGVSSGHAEYGEKMFENRIGERYYSFDHKGWHFMVLDGIEHTGENGYIGMIDSLQMEWIRSDLQNLDSITPIVVSVHIPFVTVVTQLERGALEANGKGTVVNNSREVLQLFGNHNLKLVLQGHLHYLEDIVAGNTRFITGGAVSSRWWGGHYRGMEEGFVLVRVKGNDFSWDYITFGWDAEEVDSW